MYGTGKTTILQQIAQIYKNNPEYKYKVIFYDIEPNDTMEDIYIELRKREYQIYCFNNITNVTDFVDNSACLADIYAKYSMGARHIPPSYIKLPFKMEELLKWYKRETTLNPLLKAIELHTEFVSIHPFVDGNGRTAKLLLNFELLKNKYITVIIENSQREEY